MAKEVKVRGRAANSVRQSVTIPAQLAADVRLVAKKEHLTMSRALVVLAQKGVDADAKNRDNLDVAYHHFMAENDAEHMAGSGEDLIRTIFGRNAMARDSVR